MKEFAHLLAKSSVDPDHPASTECLQGHAMAALAAADARLTAIGVAALAAVHLPVEQLTRLRRIVMLSVLIHDLGKVAEQFQWVVRRKRVPQLARHEALS